MEVRRVLQPFGVQIRSGDIRDGGRWRTSRGLPTEPHLNLKFDQVQLYVYDLSQGLARQFSRQLLGTYIDAVYHTAVVLDGIEYFYGAGVQTSYAGRTHHGRPMEIIPLGRTNLPLEVILEYLEESLKSVYTMETYDLFLHNCNNFSNDFAMFLVGRGIPEHITSLPQTVLNTPFGQVLRPQLDAAMRPITQAPVSQPQLQNGSSTASTKASHPHPHPHQKLRLPKLLGTASRPVNYTRMPPLGKVTAKLGSLAEEPIVKQISLFLEAIHGKAEKQDAPLPPLTELAVLMQRALTLLPTSDLFAAIDLFRLAVADSRVAAFFAEEAEKKTTLQLLTHVNGLGKSVPYNLRIVTVQLACNLLSSALSSRALLTDADVLKHLSALVTTGLLDEEQSNVRIAAASLAFNLSLANHRSRVNRATELLGEGDRVELIVGTLEALARETVSEEAIKALVSALGLLVYCAPEEDGFPDLCRSLDALSTVQEKSKMIKDDEIVQEVAELLKEDL